MANELNDLTYNNTPITFNAATNNIATSDELQASAIYQDKMGTAYSRNKGVAKAINFAGISLIMTAAAIKTGSLISNVYILNPPSVSNVAYDLKDRTFNASFTISNIEKYTITYYLYVNDEKEARVKEDCSEAKDYTFTYGELNKNDEGHFYIEFTNSFDYIKTIESYTFIVEE